ncbi:MAG: hypothetical protein WCB14_15005 [Candidatus Acidiferrales bacterium]
MDESALRSALASLEACSSSLHFWLEVGTFAVALGVALDTVFVVWEYLEDLHDYRRGIIHSPERPKLMLFLLGFLGAGLVAIGVSGEFLAESRIATVETCIRTGNDALFMLLSKEAGDAAKSATTAHDESDKAVAASASAVSIAGRARREADSFESRLAKAILGGTIDKSKPSASVVKGAPNKLAGSILGVVKNDCLSLYGLVTHYLHNVTPDRNRCWRSPRESLPVPRRWAL